VWVSEIGAPHLVDPSRLERSARRLYGDAFDELWGELAPVPEANVHVAAGRAAGLEVFPTPGHASHHVCYFDGVTVYAGDAAGVRIQPSPAVLPPTPPPEFDLEAWHRTLVQIEERAPERLALIHFGVADDVSRHLTELRERLDAWAHRVQEGASEQEFAAAARGDLPPEHADAYESAMPFWQSYAGLKRYWEKRAARPSPSPASGGP
jgi:glyoxylase-like metal-dependent hydrolase (beta-lactamase superfamily II)